MARRNGIVFFIILIIFVLAVLVVFPINSGILGHKGTHLGLDLVGGSYLVYQGQFSENATAAEKSAAMDRVLTTVEKRINSYGVTEPIIQKLGNDRIVVQLPQIKDLDVAKSLVEQTGYLEFRVVEKDASGTLVYLSNYIGNNTTATDFIDTKETGNRIFVNTTGNSGTQVGVAILTKDTSGLHFTDANSNPISAANLTKYASSPSWVVARGDDGTPLTGSLLSDAQPNLSSATTGSQAVVDIKWNSEGTDIFNQIAARIYDPQGDQGPPNLIHDLGIFLDNNLLEAPKVNSSSFTGGQAVIQGNFTMASATDLANLLKSGALPVELKKPPLYQQSVSATLGADSLSRSLRAGLIGILLVILFMIAYYRLLGVVATAALFVYGAISLTIFKLVPVTLTLPGIAGFIISVGMAVDANVLIFERMKEEIRIGRTLDAGVVEGFRRAWPSIRDSNVSTFITCIILYWFGSTFGAFMVKGFALTLFLGVAVSMFSAIIVTRSFLTALVRTGFAKGILLRSIK